MTIFSAKLLLNEGSLSAMLQQEHCALFFQESSVHTDTVAPNRKLPSETIGHRASPLTPLAVNVAEGHRSGGNEASGTVLFHLVQPDLS